MPKLMHSLPKYRRHRASGQAIVTLAGTDYYLGPYGTRASRTKYDRLTAEWLAHGRILPKGGPDAAFAVAELIAAYRRWAKTYYGGGSRELPQIDLAIVPLKELYGRTNAADFGPLALKAVRQKMIAADLCRNEINKRIGRVKRLFKWGVENELVAPSVFHGLQAVRGLSLGRSEARESEPVKPAPEAFIDAIKPHAAPQVWAMVELQRVTGMRPGEVTIMRSCDIDTTGAVWIYTPERHKTAHHGYRRQVYLGPRAQGILRPWLRSKLDEPLFQPCEAVAWQLEQRRLARKTPLACGNRPGTNRVRNPKRKPAKVYPVGAYANTIRRACDTANVPRWHPHQLRHNAATWLRKEFGLDVARVVLGHRSPQITEQYAEIDFSKAREVMGQVG